MARLLQGLIPLLACATAAGAAPFSHRQHLKLKLDCVTCHSTAATSARAGDNNLPARQACLTCHQDATIKTPAVTLISRFSHQQHLKFGNIAPLIRAAIDRKQYLSPPGDTRRHLNSTNSCTACHRGLEESDSVSHAAFPQMADCLVCHTKIDPPFSCPTCHVAGAQLKPATHTPDYVDRHSSGKANLDKASCAVCHGRRFTCLGCH